MHLTVLLSDPIVSFAVLLPAQVLLRLRALSALPQPLLP